MSEKKAPTPAGMPQPGSYAPMHQQYYHAAPPTYDQAMSHPVPGNAHHYAQSGWVQAGQQPGMYPNYQAAAAAAASAQNYQQYQQAASVYGAYAPAPYYSQAPAPYPSQVQQGQPTTFVMPGVATFDGSARFNSVSKPVVPPAPPGVAPNAAQVASMAGHNVVVGQKKGNFFTGSTTGGGMTFW